MKILLTGANGYIGRRLLPVLVNQGHEVVCLVRDRERISLEEPLLDGVTILEGDLLKPSTIAQWPTDIEAAYYLVHSMGSKSQGFAMQESQAANNFLRALSTTQCQQIIYLSGITNDSELSEHLTSRYEVEGILSQSDISLTVLRAAIIIGSGGASFEIIRDLVEKLPVMVAPKWLNTRCQPIAVRNVMQYLVGVLGLKAAHGKVFDIGGPDILTYKEMLLIFAKERSVKRWIFTVPVLSPRLSSRWLYFVTATSFPLAQSLVDSMRNEVVVKRKGIEELVPLELISYRKAVNMAFRRIAQNEVVSSWKDALASSAIDSRLMDFVRVPKYGCFLDRRSLPLPTEHGSVLKNLWKIGGTQGWYYLTWLWKIRGWLDKLVGGVGLRRGRRSPDQLVPGDALDFWRVLVADEAAGRLLLYAEMKLPGDAWLEWEVKNEGGQKVLQQTATFRPKGVWGRMYWYSVLPFHFFVFSGMLRAIVQGVDR